MSRLRRITFVSLTLLVFGSGLAGASCLTQLGQRLTGLRLLDQAGQADGRKLFETRCFVCHGRDGKGDGPSAIGLAEKPQDLTDANWQCNTSNEQLLTS